MVLLVKNVGDRSNLSSSHNGPTAQHTCTGSSTIWAAQLRSIPYGSGGEGFCGEEGKSVKCILDNQPGQSGESSFEGHSFPKGDISAAPPGENVRNCDSVQVKIYIRSLFLAWTKSHKSHSKSPLRRLSKGHCSFHTVAPTYKTGLILDRPPQYATSQEKPECQKFLRES